MKYLLAILFLLSTGSVFAQTGDERPLVQFTGVVYNADSAASVVQYVNIANAATGKQVATANYAGYFSFVAHEQDTIKFTSVGYNPVTVVIPANVKNKSLVMKIKMQSQIINLPVVRIWPWATVDEFKHQLLTMKIADDDLAIAMKNLDAVQLRLLERTMPRSGSPVYNAQAEHNNQVNSHSITNPLLNPFAWGKFISDITAGDKTRKSDN